MRDAYTDNNLIDYYTIMFNFITYWLLDLHFSFFYSLTSNDLQLSWAPGLPPAKSGPDRSLRRTVANGRLIRTASRSPVLTRAGVITQFFTGRMPFLPPNQQRQSTEDRDNELQIYHKNFLLMDNKHRKLVVIQQSEGSKFMPKMQQNTHRGYAPPGHAWELTRSPRPLAAMGTGYI